MTPEVKEGERKKVETKDLRKLDERWNKQTSKWLTKHCTHIAFYLPKIMDILCLGQEDTRTVTHKLYVERERIHTQIHQCTCLHSQVPTVLSFFLSVSICNCPNRAINGSVSLIIHSIASQTAMATDKGKRKRKTYTRKYYCYETDRKILLSTTQQFCFSPSLSLSLSLSLFIIRQLALASSFGQLVHLTQV